MVWNAPVGIFVILKEGKTALSQVGQGIPVMMDALSPHNHGHHDA